MKCIKCESENVSVVHEDDIACSHCNQVNNISYCVCGDCFYSFRLNCDEFLDGSEVSDDDMSTILQDVEQLLGDMVEDEAVSAKVIVPFNAPTDNAPPSSMSELLHRCVKCSSLKAYKSTDSEYICPVCGFRWEILTNE